MKVLYAEQDGNVTIPLGCRIARFIYWAICSSLATLSNFVDFGRRVRVLPKWAGNSFGASPFAPKVSVHMYLL